MTDFSGSSLLSAAKVVALRTRTEAAMRDLTVFDIIFRSRFRRSLRGGIGQLVVVKNRCYFPVGIHLHQNVLDGITELAGMGADRDA